MEELKQQETALNAMIAKGEMVEAVQKYYGEDCTFQEGNNKSRPGGKAGQIEYLGNFFKTVTKVNGIKLHSQSTGDNVSMSEWTFDLSTTGGPILWNEVLCRVWKNGKVVSEKFYTAPNVLKI